MNQVSRTPAQLSLYLRTPLASAFLLVFGSCAEAEEQPELQLSAAQTRIETVQVTGKSRASRELPLLRGPLIDVSQQVTTISAAVLEDRQVTSLEEALRNVAGVTTQIGEGGIVNGDQFFIRGQAAKNDIFTDGLRDFGAFTRDSFNFDQIAVLKGPSSTALGRGVTGGAINSGSKLAGGDTSWVLNAGVGTADYRRVTLDANTALSGTVALRVNLMAHTNDAPNRDLVHSERWGLAPALGVQLGEATTLNLIAFHQQEDRVPDYGVPVIATAAPNDIELPVTELGVPVSNFYGYAADTDDVTASTLTALLRHEVNENLTITSDSKYGVYDRYFRQTVPSCAAATCGALLIDHNPATKPVASIGGPGPYDQTTRGVQNVSTALFTAPLGGLHNEFVIGWDLSYQTNARSQFNYAGTRAAKDLFAPAHGPDPVLAAGLNNVRDTTGTDYALIIDDRLWLHPEFSLSAGARFQRFTNEQVQTNFAGTAPLTACNGVAGAFTTCTFVRESANDLINPKVAAMWEPSDTMSFYLAYSRAAVPPGNSVGNGDALAAVGVGNSIGTANLDPEESEIIDFGAKFALLDERLLLQAGVYQIDRSNAQETDPQSGNTITSSEPEQQLRGVELGVSGAVSASWLLTANYAYVDAEIVESFTGNPPVIDMTTRGRQVRYVPKHAASAWATWQPLAGALQAIEIGAGVSYQSTVYLNLQNTQETPSYAAFDALVSYRFGAARLALNAYNLSDAKYYSQVNGGRVVPAAGRSFVASLNYSF